MCICIVGLGKIGLPLAVQSASSGRDVIGVDISRDVVDSVNSGISPFSGELDLENKLSEVVTKGLLTATTDISEAVKNSSVIMVVVPLVVDQSSKPDFAIIDILLSASVTMFVWSPMPTGDCSIIDSSAKAIFLSDIYLVLSASSRSCMWENLVLKDLCLIIKS